MWKNDYKYTQYTKQQFDCPDGDHRVKIIKAGEVVSKSGKQMIEITYKVEDSNGVNFVDRMVEGEYFDANMSRIFDVFGIPIGNWNYPSWIGKIALAHFEHKDETFTDKNGVERTVSKANLIYFHNNAAKNHETVTTATATPRPVPVAPQPAPDEYPNAEPLF